MAQIGGKTRKPKAPAKPQVVIQRGFGLNEYALIGMDEKSNATLNWVGDPNAATKYDSKYDAKFRTRHIEDIPGTRVFRVLDGKATWAANGEATASFAGASAAKASAA
jgi:hypothetical protein